VLLTLNRAVVPQGASERAASRRTRDTPLRGRLEGAVVRPPGSPDHSYGAPVHSHRLAAKPARPARAVLSIRRLRCGRAPGLALPPQPAAVRPAGDNAGGSHAAALRFRTGAGAKPRRAPVDRSTAAAPPGRPGAHR